MNLRPTILLGLLAALALLVAAPAAGAASKAPATKKPAKPSAAIARQIAALERTTNTLSGEIAAAHRPGRDAGSDRQGAARARPRRRADPGPVAARGR